MTDEISLTLDLKKYRLRFNKPLLDGLSRPKFVQLLINPTTMELAVRGVETPGKDLHVHKVILAHNKSFAEIYSYTFFLKLIELDAELEAGSSYSLMGRLMDTEQAAVFSLKSKMRMEDFNE